MKKYKERLLVEEFLADKGKKTEPTRYQREVYHNTRHLKSGHKRTYYKFSNVKSSIALRNELQNYLVENGVKDPLVTNTNHIRFNGLRVAFTHPKKNISYKGGKV